MLPLWLVGATDAIRSTRVHLASQCGGGVAARGSRAAAQEYPEAVLPYVRSWHAAGEPVRVVLPGPARSWLCERAEHRYRLSIGGGQWRAVSGARRGMSALESR